MLACVLERMPRSARILDAGGVPYSVLLPSLYLYGYRQLTGVDLSLEAPIRRGSINYLPGDITRMEFADVSFDVVLCQSVLEHGVDAGAFVREASRVLAPGGLLMISVDYYCEPIDTREIKPYGLPYRIFTPAEIQTLIGSARRLGLLLTDPLDLACEERPVRWGKYRLDYTFLMLTFSKDRAEKALSVGT